MGENKPNPIKHAIKNMANIARKALMDQLVTFLLENDRKNSILHIIIMLECCIAYLTSIFLKFSVQDYATESWKVKAINIL